MSLAVPMSSPRRWALVAVSALAALAACGDDDESTTSATFEIGEPASVESSLASAFPTVATIAPVTVDTSDIPLPPLGTNDVPIVPGTADAPLLIDVVVGEDTGDDRIEEVPFGSIVTIRIVNPDDDDEYHIHGFDLGDGEEFPAGSPASFTFAADMSGDFELESHATDDVLLVLRVG